MITQKKIEDIEKEALGIIEAAVAFADASPDPDPSTVTEYVYA